ncbi:GNAT family N-acetyltransferase [Paracidovorax cattleyae]|uniref:Acetyltransferase (GNAT) domain-containing protein n=1 Tax=Paracidovorax cattleyae TaxID=80868 RepID=A0A1H0LK93_9BURK|nr:GNAT family N-acetyltransferase [Paracidovorax cattleyae]SDO68330.1 Acetyltransferase (GNAT) domain-containing protein [Paracidovorax cattleyae]
MTFSVRNALPGDVAAVFHVRTSVTENALTRPELEAMGITEASVAAMLSADLPCAWVACHGGRVVGFAIADLEAGALFAAFVLPSHEGRGIGRRLVQEAEQALFSHHAVAWLETGRETRAAGFYRRLGWGGARDVGAGDIRLEKQRPVGPGPVVALASG